VIGLHCVVQRQLDPLLACGDDRREHLRRDGGAVDPGLDLAAGTGSQGGGFVMGVLQELRAGEAEQEGAYGGQSTRAEPAKTHGVIRDAMLREPVRISPSCSVSGDEAVSAARQRAR